MRKLALRVALAAVLTFAVAGGASAHPDEEEVHVPWMDKVSADRVARTSLGPAPSFRPTPRRTRRVTAA